MKPAILVGASVSYAFSRDLRLTLLPIVIEAQAAFQGARTAPTDASGTWLRFGAGLGVAFDLF